MGVTLLRQLEEADVQCEAGSPSGDAGVYCGVERRLIDARVDPGTVMAFCCGSSESCPSWRLEVELRAEHTDVYRQMQMQRKQAQEGQARRARLVEAQRLLQGTDDESLAFQARIKRVLNGAVRAG